MRVTKRFAALTLATTATATGLVFTGTVPAFAASNPTTFAVGPNTSHSGCAVALFYSRVSASTPADVSADVDSTHPGHTCTAWVERSGTKATKWTVASAKSALPSVGGLTGVANTGLVYDGPGYKARACVQAAGSSTVTCTSAMSLAKGSGTATSPALSASYERGTASVFRVTSSGIGGVCVGLVASTTTKKTGAKVVGLLASLGDPCTAWIQTSANRGKTWTTVSPVVSYKSATKTGEGAAFTAHYADNPGHLARICVKDLTSKQQNCSGGW